MIRWLAWHLFVWAVRLVVLAIAVFTMTRVIDEELGYRMELKPMLFGALLMIVTVRIWMPWFPPKRDE